MKGLCTVDFTLPIFRKLIKLHALNINSNAIKLSKDRVRTRSDDTA